MDSAIAMASVQQTVWQGMLLLACFGLGLGVPFIVFALGYEKLKGVVTLLKKHSQTIKYIGGGMLIIVGVSMVFNLFGYYLAIFN